MTKTTVKKKITPYSVDEFGVKNYNTFYLLVITLIVLYTIIALLAIPLLHFEAAAKNANILSYHDAFWTLQMSASTIGFGDFYPVTFMGRMIIALMFYVGVGMVGFIGAQFINKFVGFSDTAIKNRELRYQNKQILKNNARIERKVEKLMKHFELIIENEDSSFKSAASQSNENDEKLPKVVFQNNHNGS